MIGPIIGTTKGSVKGDIEPRLFSGPIMMGVSQNGGPFLEVLMMSSPLEFFFVFIVI